MLQRVCLLIITAAAVLCGQWIPDNPVTGATRESDGARITLQHGTLFIQVCTDSIIRVRYSPANTFPNQPNNVVIKTTWPQSQFEFQPGAKDIVISTSRMKLAVSRADGVITYSDAKDQTLLTGGPRLMTPATVNGEPTHRAEEVFKIYGSEEAFYGLGQHQAGVWNYRGDSIDLSQENTEIAVPFWLSSRGYGVFWNNTSASRFNNRFVHYLYVTSEVADVIDYYFLYGPEFDRTIAAYRELTGAAPMYGRWAYGFWQCKNK
jgi:alpha-D-xyloside xylohydrolase